MSKNWGRTPVTNADKRAATQMKYLVDVDDGTEERIDRRPMGKVERWVDNEGGVVSLQMYGDGDPNRLATDTRMRTQLHAKGFVEHAKCPIKHGTRYSSTRAKKDFEKLLKDRPDLSDECARDPRVMEKRDGDLYAVCACPHIEALIEFRRKKAAADYKKRNAIQVAREERDAKKREIEDLQFEQARAQIEATKRTRGGKTREATE